MSSSELLVNMESPTNSDTISDQIAVSQPPTDAISALRFSRQPNSTRFAVASWDKHAYVYEIGADKDVKQIAKIEHRAPVLDVCFGKDDNEIYTACLDWDVRKINASESVLSTISTHSAGVRSVVHSAEHKLVISASWDQSLHIHPAEPQSSWTTVTIPLPSKPFSLSVSASKLVVAMSNRALFIYELSTLVRECSATTSPDTTLNLEPWQRRESSLKFMTRSICTMPSDEGYASSSIEGRVAVEWFDPSPDSQARKYAFKCHRQNEGDVDVVYPVNSIAFHPVHGSFATGGGDGVVAIWDAIAKRRIRIYPKLASSVAALDFCNNGKILVTAISPGFEDGKDEIGEGQIAIYVRVLGENEVKRKAK